MIHLLQTAHAGGPSSNWCCSPCHLYRSIQSLFKDINVISDVMHVCCHSQSSACMYVVVASHPPLHVRVCCNHVYRNSVDCIYSFFGRKHANNKLPACAGPTTAAGMAAAKGWRTSLVPSLLVGTFGYAIATFLACGLGVTVLQHI